MVIYEADFFVDGEKRLGQYTVFIVERSGDNWLPAVMALDALVTNFRLMLRPTRKKYAPAILPGHYIRGVEMTVRGRIHCVMLQLITGHELFLTPSTGKIEHFHEDLCAMKVPRRRFHADDSVARADIERLINYFRLVPSSS